MNAKDPNTHAPFKSVRFTLLLFCFSHSVQILNYLLCFHCTSAYISHVLWRILFAHFLKTPLCVSARVRAAHWCLYIKLFVRSQYMQLFFFCRRFNFRLSEVIRANSIFSVWNPSELETSACLLANILVVKRCNQILCSMCGSYIIGKPDHSEVLSAVPVSGRKLQPIFYKYLLFMCCHRFSWFFDQKHWVYIWWERPTHTHIQPKHIQCSMPLNWKW